MSPSLEAVDWGLINYDEALARQEAAVDARADGLVGDRVFLCEHPEVVTVGRRLKNPEAQRRAEEAVFGARMARIPIVEVSRGGEATLHLPGQLVGYPVIELSGARRDLHALLRAIEEAIILSLRKLGLAAERRPKYTGVWVGEHKLASIGVAVRRWVSYHGFALNIHSDTSRFALISPCGLSPDVMSSVARELDPSIALDYQSYAGAEITAFLAETLPKP